MQPMRLVCLLGVLGMCILAGAAELPQSTNSATNPAAAVAVPLTENAALDYYQAIAVMGYSLPEGLDSKLLDSNTSPEEALAGALKVAATTHKFRAALGEAMEEEHLVPSPVAAATQFPWPDDKYPFAREVRALHRGAARHFCDFGLPDVELPFCGSYLDKLSQVGLHAAFQAKACMAQRDYDAAGTILADICQMSLHLSKHGGPEAMRGWAIFEFSAYEPMNQFLACWKVQHPLDEAAASALASRMAIICQQQFDAEGYYKTESECLRRWLIRQVTDGWKQRSLEQKRQIVEECLLLTQLEGEPLVSLRSQLLADVNVFPRMAQAWTDRLVELSRRSAALSEKPYGIVRQEWAALDEDIRAQTAQFKKTGTGDSALVGLAGLDHAAAWITSRANARLRLQAIAAAAVAAKVRTGEFPANLRTLSVSFSGGLPIDPFTGGDFDYQIKDGAPVIQSSWSPADPSEKKLMPVLNLGGLAPSATKAAADE